MFEGVVEALESPAARTGAEREIGDVMGPGDPPDDLGLVRIGKDGP
jgi:hypothetical protein